MFLFSKNQHEKKTINIKDNVYKRIQNNLNNRNLCPDFNILEKSLIIDSLYTIYKESNLSEDDFLNRLSNIQQIAYAPIKTNGRTYTDSEGISIIYINQKLNKPTNDIISLSSFDFLKTFTHEALHALSNEHLKNEYIGIDEAITTLKEADIYKDYFQERFKKVELFYNPAAFYPDNPYEPYIIDNYPFSVSYECITNYVNILNKAIPEKINKFYFENDSPNILKDLESFKNLSESMDKFTQYNASKSNYHNYDLLKEINENFIEFINDYIKEKKLSDKQIENIKEIIEQNPIELIYHKEKSDEKRINMTDEILENIKENDIEFGL